MSTRLFVALALPDAITDALLGLAYGVPGARWLGEDTLHLTLRFIGDVDGGGFSDVLAALGRVRADPFELQIQGVGHFPPRGAPRQLWAGVAPSEALTALHQRVDTAITRLGHRRDRRRWKPHVTLARLDGTPSGRVARFVAAHALLRSEPFEVNAFQLLSSQLHPKGARYTVEERFPLG